MARFVAIVWVLLWGGVGPLLASGVDDERWAKGASSAAEAFALYSPTRIGILVAASDRNPGLGMRYRERALLPEVGQLDSDPVRMSERYVLRLYEAIRGAFEEKGYEVQCLNRIPWKGRRLEEVMSQAEGVDAVCAVHYRTVRSHTVFDREGYMWWSPFLGMHLRIRCAVFDRASGDLVYGLEGGALGTEVLYEELGDLVVEEPLHPDGRDRYANPSPYKIAIYHTSLKDPKSGKWIIPIIRTSKGTLSISSVDESRSAGVQTFVPGQGTGSLSGGRYVPKPEKGEERSILSRLLDRVTYRPAEDDMVYFDLIGIERCGQMVADRIPKQRP